MKCRRNFKNRQFKDIHKAYYPPILDEDPEYAASFLTDKDTNEAFSIFYHIFTSIPDSDGDCKGKFPILFNDLMYNHVNYLWFYRFYKKLCNIFNEKEPSEDLLKYAPKYNINAVLSLQYPFTLNEHNRLIYTDYETDDKDDFISGYRIKYICDNYNVNEFSRGYPAGYSLFNGTIYEKYSERTNIRVRIDYRDGSLVYFIAGASDNWQQILGIPLEVDDIVKSIIYR